MGGRERPHPLLHRYGAEGQTEAPMIMEFMRLDAERKNPPRELQSGSHDISQGHMIIT